MNKAKAVLLALTACASVGGCSDKADKRSDDGFRATPSQEAARIKMHKTTKEKRSNYQQ